MSADRPPAAGRWAWRDRIPAPAAWMVVLLPVLAALGLYGAQRLLAVPQVSARSVAAAAPLQPLIDAAPAPGVDTPEDAERMRKLFDRA